MSDREEIAERHGIPHLADHLIGDTREQLEADAAARAALAQMFTPRDPEGKPTTKAEEHRRLVEAMHPEPKEPEQTPEINVEGILTQRVKPEHLAIIRAVHPEEPGE